MTALTAASNLLTDLFGLWAPYLLMVAVTVTTTRFVAARFRVARRNAETRRRRRVHATIPLATVLPFPGARTRDIA